MGKGAAAVAQWMGHPERFADLFNGKVFQGAQIVLAEDLEPAKGESHILIEDKDSEKKEIHRFRDVTMKWKKRDGVNLAILACENQQKVNYIMPVRNMLYDSLSYYEQIEQKWNSLDKETKRKCTREEFLSHFRKGDRIIPTITLVLYYGTEKWDASQELYEMMDMNELIKEFPELQDHVQNYKLNLVDAEKIENVELFQSDLHQVFGMLKYRTDKEKLVNYMNQNSNYFGDLDRETSMVISELLHSEDILENVENTEEGERVNMCKALEDLHNDGIERGIEGMLEGLKDVGFSMEESMNRVSLKFDKTLEEVQKFAEKLWEM